MSKTRIRSPGRVYMILPENACSDISFCRFILAEINKWPFLEGVPFKSRYFDNIPVPEIAKQIRLPSFSIRLCLFYAFLDFIEAAFIYAVRHKIWLKFEDFTVFVRYLAGVDEALCEIETSEEKKQKTLVSIKKSIGII